MFLSEAEMFVFTNMLVNNALHNYILTRIHLFVYTFVHRAAVAEHCKQGEHPMKYFLYLTNRPTAVEDMGCVYSDFCMQQLYTDSPCVVSALSVSYCTLYSLCIDSNDGGRDLPPSFPLSRHNAKWFWK